MRAAVFFSLLLLVFLCLSCQPSAHEQSSADQPGEAMLIEHETIVPDLPFTLSFSGEEGGLANTGFTHVAPSYTHLSDNRASGIPGFAPSRLSFSSGRLRIDAAPEMPQSCPSNETDSAGTANSRVNMLGVAFNAHRGNFIIQTTLERPYPNHTDNFEQAGLWFGTDEEHFVKLVVQVGGIITLSSEGREAASDDGAKECIQPMDDLQRGSITLRMLVDPNALTVTAFYVLNGGKEVKLGMIPLSSKMINGARIEGHEVSFAGIFASKRTSDAAGPAIYSFENFSILTEEVKEPFFTTVEPSNNTKDVAINHFQMVVALLAPDGYELDESSLDGHVKLFRVNGSNHQVEVPANVNDTGGGDAIILTPMASLTPHTEYILRIEGVEANRIGDFDKRLPFHPFVSHFTTAMQKHNSSSSRLAGVSFTQVKGRSLGAGVADRFTNLVIGPDGKLYGSTAGEVIKRWEIREDGTLAHMEVLTPELLGSPHPSQGVRDNDERLIIGLTFDPRSTPDNLIAYVTHSAFTLSQGPEWDGKITRLSGDDLSIVKDVVIHLPRSLKDHQTNSIIFGPDSALYISQGSNTAGGISDASWGYRPERLLAGAVLKLELDKLPESEWPLDAYTTGNIHVINSAPTNSISMLDGSYNPYAEHSPLTLFATGVRNAYDLVWHSNGWLYVPTNGTAGNQRNSPNTPASIHYVPVRRPDGTLFTDRSIPGVVGGETQKDWLFKVTQGSYHGHPNPLRGEFVLNHGGIAYSGLPGQKEETYKDVAKYPDKLKPDPAYVEPAFDFGKNKSPNGVIEYKSNTFGGALKGMLLVARFSGQDDIIVMQPDNQQGDIFHFYEEVPGLQGFDDPLDLVEDPKTGNLYVAQYDRDQNVNQQLILLRADSLPAGMATSTR